MINPRSLKKNSRPKFFSLWALGLLGGVLLLTLLGYLRLHPLNRGEWTGVGPFRILELTVENQRLEGAAVWDFNLEQTRVTLTKIPREMTLAAGWIPGAYRLEGLLTLSVLETGNNSLLVSSLEQALGMRFSGVVIQKKIVQADQPIRSLLLKLLWPPQSVSISLSEWLSLYKLSLKHKPLPDMVDLITEPVWGEVTEVDGTTTLFLDKERYNNWISAKYPIQSPRLAGIVAVVVNKTELSGRANDWSYYLTNLGITVLGIKTEEADSLPSYVLISEVSPNLEILKQIFAWNFPKISVKIGSSDEYRSDLVVFLGNDRL